MLRKTYYLYKNSPKKQIEPGVWTGSIDTSHIFNLDEMPQFIDYGVSSSATQTLPYCGRGENCEARK